MLPSLKVKIGADTSDLDRKLGDTQARLRRFAKIGAAAAVAAAVATAALFVRTAAAIDAQAKLAQSLGTTVKSMQVLERAGQLAGVNMTGIGMATKDLTRRLSQAASGTGTAVDSLKTLNLTVDELMKMPLDERVLAINNAIDEFVPAAQRAAVAGTLFGDKGAIAMGRLDSETLRQATKDIDDFGVAIGEDAADQIERANDALSRIKLVFTGMANQLTVALAPAVEAVADAFANIMRIGTPFRDLLDAIFARMPVYLATVSAFAVFMGGKFVLGLAAARLATLGFAGSLTLVRGALIRTGIGALVVLLGEIVFQMIKASEKVGGFGNLLSFLGDIFKAAFDGMLIVASSWGLKFSAFGKDLQSIWTSTIAFLAKKWADFLGTIAPAYNAIAAKLGEEGIDVMGAEAYSSMLEHAAANQTTQANALREKAEAMAGGAFAGLAAAVGKFSKALSGATAESDALTESTVKLGDVGSTSLKIATGGVEELKKVLTEAQARAKSAAEMIGSKMEEAMMSMVDGTKSAQDAFKSMAKSIILELYRIFVVKRITGFLTKVISAAFGVPAAASPSYEGGGYTGRGPRSGGVDGRGGFPAIVHPNETIVDHNKAGSSMGGSVIVQQTINISTGVQQTVRNEIRQLMPQIAESAKAAVADSKRRGGSYGRAFA
tara:strand:- start:8464 stop:10455 length:1992 start_codon:yes stop_codon:yes gene_type:complete